MNVGHRPFVHEDRRTLFYYQEVISSALNMYTFIYIYIKPQISYDYYFFFFVLPPTMKNRKRIRKIARYRGRYLFRFHVHEFHSKYDPLSFKARLSVLLPTL